MQTHTLLKTTTQSYRTALVAGISTLLLNAAQAQEIIDNGTVQLGINPQGNLVTGGIGLLFIPTSGDALTPGCACEGWGVSDLSTTEFAKAGESFGDANITSAVISASGAGTLGTSSGSSALSTVTVNDGAFSATVIHNFMPSPDMRLYQVDVSIENTGAGAIGNLVYRRAMDWDIPPTPFAEYVTIQGWPAARLLASSDDGFVDGNPNVPLTPFAVDSVVDGNFTDSGPHDHGAAFDFSFGTLATSATQEFTIYYGAAASEADALLALAAVGAEVYSLGQPSSPDGETLGTPNTFIFGFAGVGGTPVVAGAASTPLNQFTGLAGITSEHHLKNPTLRIEHGLWDSLPATGKGGTPDEWNVQALAYGHDGNVDGHGRNLGFDYDSYYLGANVDRSFKACLGGFDRGILGFAIGHEDINGDWDGNLGSTDADVLSFSLYGGLVDHDGMFVDLHLFYHDLDFDQVRKGMINVYRSSTDGKSYGLRTRLGYNIKRAGGPDGKLGIYGELTYRRTEIDSFTESNMGLTTPGFSDDSVIVGVGARYAGRKHLLGRECQFTLDAAVLADLAASDKKIRQTTAGGAIVNTYIDQTGEVYGRVTASIGTDLGNDWYAQLEAGGRLGSEVTEGSLGFRVGKAF